MSLSQFKQNEPQPPLIASNDGDSFDEPKRRIPKSLKWVLGGLLSFVVLAGAGGFIATQMIDQQKYKALIIGKVEEKTGYTIDWVGNINLGMMPLPHASINQLSVKAGDIQILTVDKADIQVALAPLLSKKIEVTNVSIENPIITLTTLKNGRKTWIVSPKENISQPSSDSMSAAQVEQPIDVSVNHITISNGQFTVDNQESGSRQEFKNININLRAETLQGPFDIKGDTEWSGQKIDLKVTSGELNSAEGNFPIKANIGLPNASTDFLFSGVVDTKNISAKGDITLDTVDITKTIKAISGSSPSLPKGIDGQTSLLGKIIYSSDKILLEDMALSIGKLAYTGQMSANNIGKDSQPIFAIQLDSTAKANSDAEPIIKLLSDLKISAKASVENNKLQISTANLKTLGNDISVSGFSSIGANPTVDLNIDANAVNLDVLMGRNSSAIASDNKKAAEGVIPSSSTSPSKIGFTIPLSGRIRANIDKLTVGQKTYSDIKSDIVASAGGITISNASSVLPDLTAINISGKIADTKEMSGLNLKTTVRTPDTEKLLSTFNIPPLKLPRKIGAATVTTDISGNLDSLGFSTVISALQFNMTGKGNVANPMSAPEINSLNFTIRHPNFNDAMKTFQSGFSGSTGFFGPLDVSGQLAWSADKVNVSSISGKLGQTTIDGNISAITKPKTKISGDLNFGAIIFPSATNNGGTIDAKPSSSSPSPSSAKGDRWSREQIDISWMQSFDADLSIKAKSITQNMWKLTDANLNFKLSDGILTLNDVSAGLFGGRASINGIVKSGAGDKSPLSMSAKLNADNVDAQGLFSAATGKPNYTLSGTLSNVDVNITSIGNSSATLIQALGGQGQVNGKNIIVKGIDAAQLASAAKGSYKPLERAGSLFQSFQNGQTEFTDFKSDFIIQNGIVNFSQINFDGQKAVLNSTGNVNLPAWTIDFKNSMTVKETDIPPFDFTIRGSLDNPINSGGDIINNYLQKKLEKKATKFIEDKLGDKLDKFLGAPVEVEPPTPSVDGVEPQTETAPQPNIKDEAAKEAVKALQGLFGGR